MTLPHMDWVISNIHCIEKLTETHSAVAGAVAGADSAARLAALLQLLVRVASVLGTLAEIS